MSTDQELGKHHLTQEITASRPAFKLVEDARDRAERRRRERALQIQTFPPPPVRLPSLHRNEAPVLDRGGRGGVYRRPPLWRRILRALSGGRG